MTVTPVQAGVSCDGRHCGADGTPLISIPDSKTTADGAPIMGQTRLLRLQWQEMVWYGWTVASALVVAVSALGYLLGFDGLIGLWRG